MKMIYKDNLEKEKIKNLRKLKHFDPLSKNIYFNCEYLKPLKEKKEEKKNNSYTGKEIKNLTESEQKNNFNRENEEKLKF
jgi:hypothetical protein